MSLSHFTEAEIAAWVASSCQAQGVPVKVTDPAIIRQVGVLLGSAPERAGAQARSARTRPLGVESEAPLDVDAGGVKGPDSGRSRADHRVVHQGRDDRVLPGQGETFPRSA
jgi:hypothetical protein